jgi:hypothetical protein
MMRVAFGALYMAPATFWELTWPEWSCATAGWQLYGPPAWLGGGEGSPEPKKSPDGARRGPGGGSWEQVRELMAATPQGAERRDDVKKALREGRKAKAAAEERRRRSGRG